MDKRETSRRVNVVVGVDVQSMDEVAASRETFGTRNTRRLFTSHEIECRLRDSSSVASSYAGRFGAKEAVIKILNPQEIVPSWTEIEVRDSTSGGAEIVLRGIAAELAQRKGIVDISVSISNDGGLAMAAVVANLEIRRSGRL